MRCALSLLLVLTLAALAAAPPRPPSRPIVYRVAFPAPEHHYAQVEVTLPDLPAAPLELRMSRSSPGRYALHEFAKNVFDVQAFDGAATELRDRPAEPVPVGRRRSTTARSASSTRSSATTSTARTSASTPRTRT